MSVKSTKRGFPRAPSIPTMTVRGERYVHGSSINIDVTRPVVFDTEGFRGRSGGGG